MCGRFVSTSPPDLVAEYFGASVDVETLGENYNVAPTQDIYAVTADNDGERSVSAYRWGLLPVWAKDVKDGNRMINARSETLASKPAFKPVFRKHRCIIPMNGFYEWAPATDNAGQDGTRLTKSGKPAKQPFFIQPTTGEFLAVAGLWNAWRPKDADPDDQWLHTASVITTAANDTMAPLHNRMPVLLPESVWEMWLDPSNHDLDELSELLVPAPNDWLTTTPVTTAVNNVRNNGPELLIPADQASGPAVQ